MGNGKSITKSKEETWQLAGKILGQLSDKEKEKAVVLALKGELGAGKTTFAQGILKVAGAKGPFTSPTFVIMKKYKIGYKKQDTRYKQIPNSKFRIPNFSTIFHFDCYRVGSRDVLDLGWEEIISNPENLVLVEWPEKIQDILPKGHILIEFETKGKCKRQIGIHGN